MVVEADTIETRQQAIFRQPLGLHPMPIWFAPGIPNFGTGPCPPSTSPPARRTTPGSCGRSSQTYTSSASRIPTASMQTPHSLGRSSATVPVIPANSTIPESDSCFHDNVTGYDCGPTISHDRYEPLSFPSRKVELIWDGPGGAAGSNNSYVTSTMTGEPTFVAWFLQLALTYTELTVTGKNHGHTYQPASEAFETDPALKGTAFIAIADTHMFGTPFNITMLNPTFVPWDCINLAQFSTKRGYDSAIN